MCGICGFTRKDDSRETDQLIRRMTDLIVHRGPDEDGHLVNDHVALGMRRLSIIDVQGGSQPVFNEDGTIAVVHNGEIYNFHELRASLEARGHQFRSRCDTEVIVHLYEEYGPKFLEHLNGMYAIALWDARQQQLLLSRDRLGVKPLFYSVTNGQLVFGSEIKCLLEHSDVPQELDHQAIYDYFTLGYIPQPRSIYTSIRKLPPASYLIAKHDQIEIHQYWQLPANVDQQISRPEAKERLRELLFDAVKRRMISDVPLGAFLSGGIDSSIVVALMAQQSSRPVKTFFIDFDEKQYSERPYAQAVADRYATEHYELTVRPNALDVLDKLVWHFDEPFADASAIPTWCISQLTRNYVTVALAGDGGDEAFGGYSRYLRILRRPEFAIARRFAGPLGQAAHRLLPRTARGVRFLESLGLSNAAFYSAGTQENETRRLLAPDLLAKVDATIIEEVHGLAEDLRGLADPLAAYTRHDIRWYLPDDILTKVDRMSMAHALEVRGPFLDYRLMEFACQMPQHWKISGTNTKSILKEAFSADLPAAVLATRKRGFSPPLGQWLRGQLRPLIDELHASPAVQSGFLNTAEVRGMVREHQSGVRDRSLQLWRILVFATWWKLHQNRNAPSDGRAAAALAL